jgi:membrane protease YdiL (CAAX protease family)
MLEPWDHLFVLLFAVAWPAYEARFGYPRFLAQVSAGRREARPAAYRQAILLQWALAAAAVALWLALGRPLAGLGLGLSPGPGFLAGAALALVAHFLLETQRRAVARQPEARAQVRRQLAYAEPLLPHSSQELGIFLALAVTAGVCEEILFRGYLMSYLATWLGAWGSWFASGVVFGAAHLYLGPAAVWRAGAVGLVAGGLYLLTGSLWIPMLLHALLDRNAGQIAGLVYGSAASEGSAVDDSAA